MTKTIKTKRCSNCKEIKPIFDFGLDRTTKDGRQYHCKPCKLALDRLWRKTPRGRASSLRRMYRQKEKSPKKYKARYVLNNAIKLGKWQSAKTCECVYCGEQAALWHHWAGYEKEHWFDIIPLCKKCDIEAHKSLGKKMAM